MPQNIIDFIFELSIKEAELSAFTSAVQLAIAANFGFSALFKLGTFSGHSVDVWAEREKRRVFAAMAETPNFNGLRFSQNIDTLKNSYRKIIYCINCTAAVWAVIVAIIGVPILVLMPYYSSYVVSGKMAMICGVTGFGPIPVGMVVALTLHIIARTHMWRLQKTHNVVIDYLQPPIEQIRQARETLRGSRRSSNKNNPAKRR